jgi:L-amino acid N-acyltransferase YncA
MESTIRAATLADAPFLSAIYAPSVVGAVTSFEVEAPTASDMEHRIAALSGYAPWLVCAEADRPIGFAYAYRHRERLAYRWSVDVSVYIDRDHHRRGVGRALYTSLFALLRIQGFRAAHAGITLPNPGSVGLHESFGFRLIGVYPAVGYKLGGWHDVGWWQLELGDRRGEPPELLTVGEAERDPRWSAALASGVARLATVPRGR